MSPEVFVSTGTRRACSRGVIGSTMGAYPRGTCSKYVQGNGHIFPHTVSSIFRLALTHTHTHTHTHTRARVCARATAREKVRQTDDWLLLEGNLAAFLKCRLR